MFQIRIQNCLLCTIVLHPHYYVSTRWLSYPTLTTNYDVELRGLGSMTIDLRIWQPLLAIESSRRSYEFKAINKDSLTFSIIIIVTHQTINQTSTTILINATYIIIEFDKLVARPSRAQHQTRTRDLALLAQALLFKTQGHDCAVI